MSDIFRRNMDAPLLQRDAHRFPFIFKCAEDNCNWHTAHASWGQAANTRLVHRAGTCPLDGRSKLGRNGVAVGSTIIEEFWNDLDAVTKQIIETPADQKDSEEFRVARGQAQGIAQCIWRISVPHFEAVEHVKKWAVRRYKMEHTDLEFEPTPGVKGYNPPVPANVQMQVVPERRPAARRTAAPSGEDELRTMDEAKRTLATNAVKAGFPDNKIVQLAKVSMSALAAIRAEVAASK